MNTVKPHGTETSVTTYDWDTDGMYPARDREGGYVRYNDYESLESRLRAAEAELAALRQGPGDEAVREAMGVIYAFGERARSGGNTAWDVATLAAAARALASHVRAHHGDNKKEGNDE